MMNGDINEVLQGMNQRLEEVIRSIGELMTRQNHLDSQVENLLSRNAAAGGPADGRGRTATNAPFPDESLRPEGSLLRSSRTEGWKPVRNKKIYLEIIPTYDGKASSWTTFMTKVRLTLDEAYEWAPLFLRMTEKY